MQDNNIKRILNVADYQQLVEDMFSHFSEEYDINYGHQLLIHDKNFLKSMVVHQSTLAWDFFVWANHNGQKYDSVIAFNNEKNSKFGKRLFSEFMWLSSNQITGYKLFKEAINFARQKDFEYIVMSTVVQHPKHEKIKNFYEKMGFLKDSETYISKL